jgi:hypothetical protein
MDIREHLKSLPVAKLKDLARRHNALYRIKIGQTKAELVESLARQYEKMTGTHLIPKRGENLLINKIKVGVIKKKQPPPLPQPPPPKLPKPLEKEELQEIKKKLKANMEHERAKKMYKIHKKPLKVIKKKAKELGIDVF